MKEAVSYQLSAISRQLRCAGSGRLIHFGGGL
jgi:hypothetical protein